MSGTTGRSFWSLADFLALKSQKKFGEKYVKLQYYRPLVPLQRYYRLLITGTTGRTVVFCGSAAGAAGFFRTWNSNGSGGDGTA